MYCMERKPTRYFTDKPCKYGHICERLVSNNRCVECANISSSKWKKAHRPICTTASRQWRQRNSEKVRELKRSYYKTDERTRALQLARARKWYEANRDKNRAACANWRKNNLAVAAAAQTRRRAKKLQRTPVWADHDKILQFYILARELTDTTGIEHHVDHIVPLQGEMVSGLHVETNLQVIPGIENKSKGARFLALQLEQEE
jgi:hypothetical protein